MKIQPIKFNYTSFKSSYQDDGIIGYDDSISQEKRNYLRMHYDSWHMPYQSIYEKGLRLSDYQMKLFIDDLERNHDIQQIEGTNIYRGQTLVDRPEDLFKLRHKGIQTVIDLVGYGESYENAVKQAGMEYYAYNIYDNWWCTVDFKPEHINKLVDFLSQMQKGNIYIGCQHGANDTDIAFILNDFFNPLLEGKAKTKIPANDSDFPYKLNMIYDMLSKVQKEKLGWTKEFEQRLLKKLISI